MTTAVAVSGGMDSLFTLLLLKERGLDVFAIHAHFLPPSDTTARTVAALTERCAELGVPFHAVDLSREFDEQVITPFVRGYAEGHTPNPCATCNPAMKFGLLFDRARELGADTLSTGHYARMLDTPTGKRLYRGADPVKDQSYFLSLVPRERLEHAILPLGDWCKADVRGALEARGVVVPLPSESQEICFVPGDDYCAFLRSRMDRLPGPGPIELEDGTTVGRHNGLWRHTLGQRRGIGVAWSEPLYVLDKDTARNALIVGTAERLPATGCTLGDVNILVPPAAWPETVLVQTRYRQKAKPAHATLAGDTLRLSFIEPHTRPTPGQVGALYDHDGSVLAGGRIRNA
ncbi:tRNA-specific 2-thiouridylase [Desulfobaculum xiamenense]|uniref:tRNA-specific 2-thiouridylase MnmA n=1 Tax=Desulfobaculum xiamenense TaxID=995050 RepID=A0A846QR41_9BACT|nr:tRNA 2-thiouridine(34) synthase MnmA [Desulfobaculum xiamenense]NJB69450.1 tRNA-specific 2-thiouridylase [Desulfobaculum xiamenense]